MNPQSSTQAGPSRPPPSTSTSSTGASKSKNLRMAYVDLTGDSGDEDFTVIPRGQSILSTRPNDRSLKPSSKCNVPSSRSNKSSASHSKPPSSKQSRGSSTHDAISISSSESIGPSKRPESIRGVSSKDAKGSASGRSRRQASMESRGSRASSRTRTTGIHPMFTSSSSRRVKPEPNSSPVKPTFKASRSSRVIDMDEVDESTPRASSSKRLNDEANAFFTDRTPTSRSGIPPSVQSPIAALRAAAPKGIETNASAGPSHRRVPSKTDHSSFCVSEKRKRLAEHSEVEYAPRRASSRTLSPAAPRVRNRSERTANKPPVDYTVPTMDAPLKDWTRQSSNNSAAGTSRQPPPPSPSRPKSTLKSSTKLTPTASGSSSALSTAPQSSHHGHIDARSVSPVPTPRRRVPPSSSAPKTPAIMAGGVPMIRTGSDSSALTSLSSQPTPSRRNKDLPSSRQTPKGKERMPMSASSHKRTPSHLDTPSKSHITLSKTPGRTPKATRPIEEADTDGDEFEIDLDAELFNFDFLPDSPPASVSKLSQNGDSLATPSRSRVASLVEECKAGQGLTPSRTMTGLSPRPQSISGSSRKTPSSIIGGRSTTPSVPLAHPDLQKAPSLSPETQAKRLKEQEEDARIAHEIKRKAEDIEKAAEASKARWAAWNSKPVNPDEDSEGEDEIADASLLASTQALQKESQAQRAKQQALAEAQAQALADAQQPSPPTRKRTEAELAQAKDDRSTSRIFDQMSKDAERDASFRAAQGSAEDGSPVEGGRNFAYPTPMSRDPSLEPPPRAATAAGVKVEMSEVSLQDLDKETRNGTENVIKMMKNAEEAAKRNKAEDIWVGVWTGLESPALLAAENVEISEIGLYTGGSWRLGIKSAKRRDFAMLNMLIESPRSLHQLDASSTQALASFCLRTWLLRGTSTALPCLTRLADLASVNPFSTSADIRDIICTILSAFGIDETILPGYQRVEDLIRPRGERAAIVGSIAILLSKLIRNKHFVGSAAIDLVPVLSLLHADPTTSSACKDHIQSALSQLWAVCLADTTTIKMAINLIKASESLPIASKRDIMLSIGMSSEEARSISRWFAAGTLIPDLLNEITDDTTSLVPSLSSCMKGVSSVYNHLDMPNPNHSIVEIYIGFLYEMMGDVSALIETIPIPKEGVDHEIVELKHAAKRAADRIKTTITPPPKLLSNKTKLDMLPRVIGMKADLALVRLRGEQESKVVEEAKVKKEEEGRASLIVPGKGGQSTLNFGPKKAVV